MAQGRLLRVNFIRISRGEYRQLYLLFKLLLRNRSRPTDIENKFMDTKGKEWGRDKLGDLRLTYTHYCLSWTEEPDGLQFTGLSQVGHN